MHYTGLVNEDTATSLGLPTTGCTTLATTPAAGHYLVTCTNRSTTDYDVTYNSGTLTVAKAALLVAPISASMTYGETVPVLGVSVTGYAIDNDQTITGSLVCTTDTETPHVGPHPITCSGLTSDNYAIDDSATGTLTVNPANVTVTAPSLTRYVGTANPTLAPTYSGFVPGEGVSALTSPATCSTPATISSPARAYEITCSGAAAADYTFSYLPGTLTVKVNFQIKVFTQPINDGAGAIQSVFKGGSTVPVKFQITDLNGALLPDSQAQPIADACGAKITYGFVSAGVGPLDESALSITPTSGSCFRYDATADQFIFNLSTKSMATGTWTLRATVKMVDTSVISHEVNIGLR